MTSIQTQANHFSLEAGYGRAQSEPECPTVPVPGMDHRTSARSVLRNRDRRAKFLNSQLFADPAWDMLLELYCAELDQRRMSVTRLCIASRVPATTGLRWLATLDKEGLITRRSDPLDQRRVFVALSDCGRSAMRHYFEGMRCSCCNAKAELSRLESSGFPQH